MELRDLSGSRWELALLLDDGGPTYPTGGSIEFAVSGRVSGSTGCNRFNGPCQIVDGRLLIGRLAVTRGACKGERQAQEQFIVAMLRSHPRLRLDGTDLIIETPDGNQARYRPGVGPLH